MNIKACVFGASGYAGAELVALLQRHPVFSVQSVLVSANSHDAGEYLQDLYPQLVGLQKLQLQAGTDEQLQLMADSMDVIFLATPHEFSHDQMSVFTSGKARVMDLSGAFRIKNATTFEEYYGFAHQQPELLEKAVYGLVDWFEAQLKDATLVAVPGCYPTASLLALKPLFNAGLLDKSQWPVINAVSGVSGAGRKASMTNSLCEVSLQAYGVQQHRHQPEIVDWLGTDVIFTPHLGNFKRGILATITVRLNQGVTEQQIQDCYQNSYANSPMVRLRSRFPKVDDVVGTTCCDIAWKYNPQSGYLVVGSAIDNLLKGAAGQAVQCANISFGLDKNTGFM
ncbi:N-acetyl-gamma-glutamyl-phosphate reductase [Alteromonadaceae bacterium BrNp21-10]|nr:N-acetyl-gamma-glutamyl-phosphate reductase [Alteromonadaceae bacterium BrNp21-10]